MHCENNEVFYGYIVSFMIRAIVKLILRQICSSHKDVSLLDTIHQRMTFQ